MNKPQTALECASFVVLLLLAVCTDGIMDAYGELGFALCAGGGIALAAGL